LELRLLPPGEQLEPVWQENKAAQPDG